MSEIKVKVTTGNGQVIGYFVSPAVENLCGEEWEVKGVLFDEAGRAFDKVEFNPEVVPYLLDVSQMKDLGFSCLSNGYVQRGRQPVTMTAKKR